MEFSSTAVRVVHWSEIQNQAEGALLAHYIADRTPLLYRRPDTFVESILDGGYLGSALRETLARLPTATSFQQSHFGEIAASIYAEEVLRLKLLYRKLSLLTAENSNAHKMDLLLYDPSVDPIELVLAEVKYSPKISADGSPVGHDQGCFADVFRSLNSYSDADRNFDLTAAKDNLGQLDGEERARVRAALRPYARTKVRYLAFAVIDLDTKNDDEARVLGRRQCTKPDLAVDLVCIEKLSEVTESTWKVLATLREAVSVFKS
jgi:hypothetical protein